MRARGVAVRCCGSPSAVQAGANVSDHWRCMRVRGKALHVARHAHGEPRAAGAGVVGHEVKQGCGDRFDRALIGLLRWHAKSFRVVAGWLRLIAGWLAQEVSFQAVRMSFPFWVRRSLYSLPLCTLSNSRRDPSNASLVTRWSGCGGELNARFAVLIRER